MGAFFSCKYSSYPLDWDEFQRSEFCRLFYMKISKRSVAGSTYSYNSSPTFVLTQKNWTKHERFQFYRHFPTKNLERERRACTRFETRLPIGSDLYLPLPQFPAVLPSIFIYLGQVMVIFIKSPHSYFSSFLASLNYLLRAWPFKGQHLPSVGE